MNIHDASERIKALYRCEEIVESTWKMALEQFDTALDNESSASELEKCILNDENWELHVEGRLALLRKAKAFGASSRRFLLDYFGYLAAHLSSVSEQEDASKQLEILLNRN